MFYKKIKYKDLNVTLPEVYEQMGYGSSADSDIESRVGDDVKEEVAGILREIEAFLEPELCFYITRGELLEHPDSRAFGLPDIRTSEFPSFRTPGLPDTRIPDTPVLIVNGRALNIGKIIYRQLRGSELFAFFVCTAGRAFQEYQNRLKAEGDIVREFTANAIGSVLAEKTADVMEKELRTFLSSFPRSAISSPSPLHHTNRFSPGYCGWHVREQKLLFATFPVENPCGVQLTDSCLMLPIKSVSGVIGIGENVRHLDYTCGLCDYEKCYKRRKKGVNS